MVDNDVFRRNGREAIIVILGDALGEAGFKGLVKEIGAVADNKLGYVGDREEAIYDNHIVTASLQPLDDELPGPSGSEALISTQITSPSCLCTSARRRTF